MIFYYDKAKALVYYDTIPQMELINLDKACPYNRLWMCKTYEKPFCVWLNSEKCTSVSANSPDKELMILMVLWKNIIKYTIVATDIHGVVSI